MKREFRQGGSVDNKIQTGCLRTMKNRSAALFLLLGLLLAAPHAIRAEKDEINARYKEAMARNDVEQAMSILCDAAKVDPKKYEKRCTNAQVDANKQLQKFEILFNTGKAELDRKDYSGAIRDLEKITFRSSQGGGAEPYPRGERRPGTSSGSGPRTGPPWA